MSRANTREMTVVTPNWRRALFMPGGPAEEPDGAEGKEEPAAGQGLEDMPVWKRISGFE